VSGAVRSQRRNFP